MPESFWNVLGNTRDTPGVKYLWNGNEIKFYDGINENKFDAIELKKTIKKNYSELKHELGFFQQIKTVFKEPENIKTKRLSLANDFEKVISLTDSIYNSAKEEQKYVINETKKVYNFVKNAYEGKWMKQQKHVIFAKPECCHHKH